MNTEAWIAVGVVAYLIVGALVVGVVLGLSPPEVIEDFTGFQMFALVIIWPIVVIVGLVLAVAELTEWWWEKTRGKREPMDTEEGIKE